MQQIDDLLQGVYDLLMTAYPESINASTGPFPVHDNVLTSSQIIRLRLKAPGLLPIPGIDVPSCGGVKRALDVDQAYSGQELTKRIRICATGTVEGSTCSSSEPTPPPPSSENPGPSSNGDVKPSPPPSTSQQQELTPILEYRLRPHFRKCIECNLMFGNNSQLAVHIATAHKNSHTWPCIARQTCPLIFMDPRSMRTHVYEIHIKECPVCKCKFEESSLARHIICTHAELTLCPICNNQYTEQHELMVHVKTQHDLPSYRLRTESTLSVKSETASP